MTFMHFDAFTVAASVTQDVVNLNGNRTFFSIGGSGATVGLTWSHQTPFDLRIYEQYMNPVNYSYLPLENWVVKPPSANFDPSDYEFRFAASVGTAPFSVGSQRFPNDVLWYDMGVSGNSIFYVASYGGSFASTLYLDIRHATIGAKNSVSSQHDGAPCMATTSLYRVSLVNSGFCDKRLKTNIEHVDTIGGIRLYTWDWTDEAVEKGLDHGDRFGAIAQEVIDDHPEAVWLHESGYYGVDHVKIAPFKDPENKQKLDECSWKYSPTYPELPEL